MRIFKVNEKKLQIKLTKVIENYLSRYLLRNNNAEVS